ncbi:hypothetical protein TNCV_4612251 [Trichonephila clavipes]|nr:hypothetical protein TNCV_4612251 [Trichonephila clavipes]
MMYDGASTSAAGVVEIMQVDDESTSLLTPVYVGIDCVRLSFMKNTWGGAFVPFSTTFATIHSDISVM